MKLGRNASDTCAFLSKAYGGESVQKSRVFSGINGLKRSRMSKSQMKTVLITFFDIKGTVHFEFIPQVQKVDQAYYVEILKQLHEAAHRKWPELFSQPLGFL
jgi:hypothetical protein